MSSLELYRNLHREEAAMTDISEPSSTVRPSKSESVSRRRAVRYGTAALCGVIGVLYLVLFFLVRDAEAGLTENTFGA